MNRLRCDCGDTECPSCGPAQGTRAAPRTGGERISRASYRAAIDWVARNDSAGCDDADDPAIVQDLITAVLVADIFGVSSAKVGDDIVRRRAAIARGAP